jgi:tetratricopeptide (TPR) repeat protein
VSTKQSAEAHELLGDVYMYWKQYDLSISAFKISLQNTETASAQLKLADAYTKNGEFQKSISTYKNLDEESLSNYEKILLYEGIGDAHLKLKNIQAAIKSYETGLEVAKKHLIAPKVTDLNSKIAQAYNEKGEVTKAKSYYSNSLKLAKKENKKRAVEEQVKVAEFNNLNQEYDSEIELRKGVLESIEDIEKDSVLPNESPLTLQKQNYKLANAYYLNNDLDNAISYFEKSIEEADKKGDLEVKKDATRRASEVYYSLGEDEKGREAIDEFKSVVDELYAKKYKNYLKLLDLVETLESNKTE